MTRSQARQWLLSQRCEYRFGRLSSDKIRFLESQPGWCWERLRNVTPDQEKIEQIKHLAKKSGGKICPENLIKKSGIKYELFIFWRNNKKLFKHIVVPNLRRHVTQVAIKKTVKKLEQIQLEKSHIPSITWFKVRYPKMYPYVYAYPKQFAHIKFNTGYGNSGRKRTERVRCRAHKNMKQYSKRSSTWWHRRFPGDLNFVGRNPEMFPLSKYPRTWALPKSAKKS